MALPSGVTFTDNGDGTGTLSGTPVAGTGGTYALTFTATNTTGSTPPQAFTMTVNEAPTITSFNAATFTTGTNGTFTVTTTGFPKPSIARNGAALPSSVTFTDNGSGTGTLSGIPGANTGGTYAITFTATNTVSSTTPQNFTLTVNQAPAITSASATTFTAGTAGTLTITTTGFPAPALVRGGVALPSGVTFVDNGNGTGTLSGTPDAGTGRTYALTFTASSAAGSTAPQSFTLTVNQTPAITSANATAFTVGSPGTFTVTATGFPTPALVRGGVNLPSGVFFTDNGNGTGTLSGTPAAGTNGGYALTFTATNAAGSSAPQAFTLTVTNAPTIQSADHATFTVGSSGTFTVTAVGDPTPALAISGAALPGNVTFTDNGNGTGTLSGTPAAGTGGTYALNFTASNGTLPDAVQNFTLTIDQAPAITSASATTFTVGASGTFSVTTSGFPTAALVQSGALPSGVTFIDNGNGTGTLSGTPSAGTAGPYAIAFTASNTAGSTGPQNFTLTVAQPPMIVSGPLAAPNPANVGATVDFSVGVTAAAGANLTYAWDFGDGSDGSGAAPSHIFAEAGNYTVSVTVSDGTTSVSGTVSVTVNAIAAVVGGGLDSDGDGFSDAFESANGSDPSNPNSTPFANQKITATGVLTFGTSSIKLDFAAGGKDAIKFTGKVAVPAGFSPAGQTVYATVGNVLAAFPLTSKGTAKTAAGTFAVKLKLTRKVVVAQTSAFAVSLAKGTFAANLASFGLANATVKTTVSVPFGLFFNSTMLTHTQSMSYVGKQGKTGAAK